MQFEHQDSTPDYEETTSEGSAMGWLGVLAGLVLLVAFFLPWGDGQSAFDAVKQDLRADSFVGEVLYKLIFGSTALAGMGSLFFGFRLATHGYRGAPFRSWMSTSLGAMVVLGGFLPALFLSYALLGDTLDELQGGIWLSLGSDLLLAFVGLVGLSSALSEHEENSYSPPGSSGIPAIIVGTVLIIAFFLPWGAEGSGYDIIKADLGSNSLPGELLFKAIFGSTVLAGIGSLIFGIGRANSADRTAAFRAWMTTSISAMGLMAGFIPSFLWSTALLAGFEDQLKIGVWLSLGAAVALIIAAIVDLSSQQEEM